MNAKELCLAKLNANAKMAGMYIYGLTMGISFQDLGELLMSDIGNTVSSYLKGSIISDKLRLNTIDNVLDFLDSPYSKLKSIYSSQRLWEYATGKTSNRSVWKELFDTFFTSGTQGSLAHPGELANQIYRQGFNKFLDQAFKNIKSGKSEASDIIATLESMRAKINRQDRKIHQNKWMLNEAIDAIEDAINKIVQIKKVGNEAYEDFKRLNKGASELKLLGQILGANQGVRNPFVDFMSYVNTFETAIAKISGDSKDRFDFTDFMTNPKYREEQTQNYEKNKVSFNILKVVQTVPHYWGYLSTVFAKHQYMKQTSVKYRTIYDNLQRVENIVGKMDLEKKINSMVNLVDYKLINQYLANKSFHIPTGVDIISLETAEQSTRIPATELTKIHLGTQGGNATFKNWVEQHVIPDLKEGFTTSDHRYRNPVLANNGFIKSLRPNIFTKNPNKNQSISFTADINMSPRNDEDRLQLDLLKQDFETIRANYTVVDGNMQYSIPIKDIFFWYNLITYNNKPGQGTLTNLFDNYIKGVEGKSFNASIASIDNTNQIFGIEESELINWLAQIESPYATYNKYVYYKNKKDLSTDLLKQVQGEDPDGNPIKGEFGRYNKDGSLQKLDTNLILHRPSHGDIQKIELEANGNTWTVSYNPVVGKIQSISSKSDQLPTDKLSELNKNISLVTSYNPNTGEYLLNNDLIKEIIEQHNNC